MDEMEQYPALWIVVLNWNQKEVTAACLNSLAASNVKRQFRVVMVDNGSTDGSPDYFRENFPWVEVLVNSTNLGFTGGNNIGIHYALARGATLILLLNNDTEVSTDCIEQLLLAVTTHPEYALFCPKIYYYDDPQRLWYGGGDIRLDRPLGAIHRGMKMLDSHQYDEETEITFVTGCAFLIRCEVIKSIGLLDEDLFIYCEDLDWCVRARRAGYRSLFVPHARLWHKVSQTYNTPGLQPRTTKTYLFARNRFIVQKRYLSIWRVGALIPKYLMSSVARRAYRYFLAQDTQHLVALWYGILDGIRGAPRRHLS